MFSLQFWVLWPVLGVFLGCSACSWGVRLFRNDGQKIPQAAVGVVTLPILALTSLMIILISRFGVVSIVSYKQL